MTGRAAPHLPSQGAELGTAAPLSPRLGDLARDTAHGGEIGVVIALPGADAATYHLRPPGGGEEWTAPADGTTLRLVPAQVTYVVSARRDVAYDHRAQQGALPVRVHFEDGGNTESLLVLDPGQLELLHYQVGRIIELRGRARGCAI